MKIVDILRATREKLSDPKKWVKGTNTDVEGRQCLAYTLFQVAGMVDNSNQNIVVRFQDEVTRVLGFESASNLVDFNDSRLTTHQMLLARLDKGIADAEANTGRTDSLPESVPGPRTN